MFEVRLQKGPPSGVLVGFSFVCHAETSSEKKINHTTRSDAKENYITYLFSVVFKVSSGVGGGRRESMVKKRREGEKKKKPLV